MSLPLLRAELVVAVDGAAVARGPSAYLRLKDGMKTTLS